ncbi:hypothetical protein, partial [Staphylococcus aureus]
KHNKIDEIKCLLTTKERAYYIMEIIHSGENQGKGVKQWNSKEKQEFSKRRKKKVNIGFIIADTLTKNLSTDVTKKIPLTTLDRLFNNIAVKKRLGLNKEELDSGNAIPKNKLLIINYLIDTVEKEAREKKIAVSRLLNRAREIEDFIIPLIDNYEQNNDLSNVNDSVTKTINKIEKEVSNNKVKKEEIKEFNQQIDNSKSQKVDVENEKETIKIEVNRESLIISEKDNVNLMENIKTKIEGDKYIEFKSDELNIEDYKIVSPNIPGKYSLNIFLWKNNKKSILIDSRTISIEIKEKNREVRSEKCLSNKFYNKYYEKIECFDAVELNKLIYFLSKENINGEYSVLIKIAVRMFLEYSFKYYALQAMNMSEAEMELKDKNLEGFLNSILEKLEKNNKNEFSRSISKARKDATKKLGILQKSIHYPYVNISIDDVKSIIKNLDKHLNHIYDYFVSK